MKQETRGDSGSEPRYRDGIVLLLICIVLWFLRISNISSVTLPLWVDSVHHAAIVRLILAHAGLPESFRPFADVDRVNYHFGYHAAVAILTRLSGLSVEQTMLWFGQILNVLACLTLYPLAMAWTGRRSAALLAVVVPGTISLMPAYYVTWGRYTQLAGLVVLPLAILAYQRAAEQGTWRSVVAAAVAAALLFWIHYRVTYYFATFVVAYLLYHMLAARSRRFLKFALSRTAAVAAGALLLSSPWLWRLWTTILQPFETLANRLAGSNDYNAIPFDILERPGMVIPLAAAAAGAVIALGRGGDHRRWATLVLLWVGVTAFLLNPGILGMRPTWVVNNFSAVIALYVPEALLIALGLASLGDWISSHRPGRIDNWLQAAVTLVAIVTAPSLVDIVNPVTVLADQDDIAAMNWIRENTPEGAIFLVNERYWQGQTYVGTDAGYWIPNLTERRTTMPIAFYTQGVPEYWQGVNELARLIESSPDPEAPSFLAALQSRGVTHVYIGSKGGPLALDKLNAGSHYRLLHRSGGAHVFEILY